MESTAYTSVDSINLLVDGRTYGVGPGAGVGLGQNFISPGLHSSRKKAHSSHSLPSLNLHTPYSLPASSLRISSWPPLSMQLVEAGFARPAPPSTVGDGVVPAHASRIPITIPMSRISKSFRIIAMT